MHFASGKEARAVAWAVPGLLQTVPVDVAAHVGADGRHASDVAFVVLEGGDALAVEAEQLAFALPEVRKRCSLGPCEAIADQVVGIARVLFDVIPRSGNGFDAAGIEELRPRVRPAQ